MDSFTALADPTRRAVLALLRDRPLPAGEIANAFPGQSQPGMSRHLRVLREAGLVDVRAEEQRRIYSLRAEGFAELDAWLSSYGRFWEQKLDALERHLDERARAKTKDQTGTTGKSRKTRKIRTTEENR